MATCSKHVDDDDNVDEHDGATHNPIFGTSAGGQRCRPVLLASGVTGAGQWCWPVVLASGAVQFSLANLASVLCGVHTHARTCSNVF